MPSPEHLTTAADQGSGGLGAAIVAGFMTLASWFHRGQGLKGLRSRLMKIERDIPSKAEFREMFQDLKNDIKEVNSDVKAVHQRMDAHLNDHAGGRV